MKIINNRPKKGLNTNDVYNKLIKGENVFVEFKKYNNDPEKVKNAEVKNMFMCSNKVGNGKLSEMELYVMWIDDNGIFVKEEKLTPYVIDFYLDDRVIVGLSVIESFDKLLFTSKEYLTGENLD